MADYSTASDNAIDALNESTDGGFVEEYQIGRGVQRVRRGRPQDQVAAALLLEGIAARRSGGGLLKVAKLRRPRS